MNDCRLICGDAIEVLGTLPAGSARTCVTSPPYFGLRDYGVPGQIGLEDTPDAYVARLVEVFRAVRRVLADDGTLWLNLGDSYASPPAGNKPDRPSGFQQQSAAGRSGTLAQFGGDSRRFGLAPKQLLGIPWRVAFALQADGWYLRSDIIWHKPNPMPESVRDRPTKSHEYLFLLSKRDRYFYDAAAVREPGIGSHPRGNNSRINPHRHPGEAGNNHLWGDPLGAGRNRRSVWKIATSSYSGAHFAVMPETLVEPCILAGSAAGDTVLDPFAGSGTVPAVAMKHGRKAVGIDLNAAYLDLACARVDAACAALEAA